MPEAAPTLAILRRLAADADEVAWQELLDRHAGRLLQVARGRCRDHHLAEDGVQEALLYIRDHADECRATNEAQAVAWLCRVAATSTTQVVRGQTARTRRDRRAGEREVQPAADPADEQVAQRELHQHLHRALADLPERHRLPLELHYFGQLDHRGMADAMRCSPGAARVRVHRALKRLQAGLARLGVTAGLGAIAARLEAGEAATGDHADRWQDLLHAPTAAADSLSVSASAGGQLVFTIKIALAAAVVGGVSVAHFAGDQPPPDAMPIGENPVVDERPANPPDDETAGGGDEIVDPLDQEIEFAFTETPLRDVLATIERTTGLAFEPDPAFGEALLADAPPVTLEGTMEVRVLLKWIEQLCDVRFEPEDDASVTVGPPLARRLAVVGDLDVPEADLEDVVAEVAAWPGAPRIEVLAGTTRVAPITVSMSGVTVDTALLFLEQQTGYERLVHHGGILLLPELPEHRVAQRPTPVLDLEEAPEGVAQRFDQFLTLNLSGIEIATAIDFLQRTTGMTMVVDPEIVAGDEVPTVEISAAGQPLRQVLTDCLEQADLVARWQDEALYITRPEALEPRLEARSLATGRVHAVRRVDGAVDLVVVDRGSADGLAPGSRLVGEGTAGTVDLEVVELAPAHAICRPVDGNADLAPGAALVDDGGP